MELTNFLRCLLALCALAQAAGVMILTSLICIESLDYNDEQAVDLCALDSEGPDDLFPRYSHSKSLTLGGLFHLGDAKCAVAKERVDNLCLFSHFPRPISFGGTIETGERLYDDAKRPTN